MNITYISVTFTDISRINNGLFDYIKIVCYSKIRVNPERDDEGFHDHILPVYLHLRPLFINPLVSTVTHRVLCDGDSPAV